MKACGQTTWQDFQHAWLLHYRTGVLGRVILSIVVVVLYTDRERFQILPKRFFADQEEIDTLKSCLNPEVFHQKNFARNAQMVMLLISLTVIALIVIITFH